jgi:hypothetical protein
MGKIVDPRCVFRTADGGEVEAALRLLQRSGFPAALQSALEADVMVVLEEGEVLDQGLSHSLWIAGERAEAAADRLRSGGFAGLVEPPMRPRSRRSDELARFLLAGLALSLVVWILVVISVLTK